MLEPYRTLGLVNGNTAKPFLQRRSTEYFITCAIDSVLQLYDISKLRLKGCSPILVCGDTETVIKSIVCWKDWTYVASFDTILVFYRLQLKENWKEHTKEISHLLIFGTVLLSVSSAEQRVIVWDLTSHEKVAEFYLSVGFVVTCVEHPETYLNKVLLASEQGHLQLWNVRSCRLLYEYESFGSTITSMRSTPALDIVALGLADGRTILFHLKRNQTVMEFFHQKSNQNVNTSLSRNHLSMDQMPFDGCPVLDIAFRSDGYSEMAVSYSDGSIVFFDLKQREVKYKLSKVHLGGAWFIQYLLGEPLLVTAGQRDNCIKVHISDRVMEPPRLLRFREGHMMPPIRLRFAADNPRILLSCSIDRELRLISLFRDAQSKGLSQQVSSLIGGKRKRKHLRKQKGIEIGAPLRIQEDVRGILPRICAIAVGSLRARDAEFADIVTCHEGCLEAYCWKLENGTLTHKVLSRKLLTKDAFHKNSVGKKKHSGYRLEQANCVAISPCGNFASIGTDLGMLDLYNLQSGSYRSSWTDDQCSSRAHLLAVTGVEFDNLGETLVSGSIDGLLKFWSRQELKLLYTIEIGIPIVQVVWGYVCNLLAILCDNFEIHLVDPETKQLARRFIGHQGPLTDAQFSGDGYFLLSSSLDGSLRVWNIQLGRCVDIFEFEHAPISIAFSPNNDFIATCHSNCIGIALWSNQHHFKTNAVESHSSVITNSKELLGRLPHIGEFQWRSPLSIQNTLQDHLNRMPKKENLSSFTLSGKPLHYLLTLVNWDIVKKRSQPQQPVKKQAEAPFFLSSHVLGKESTLDTFHSTENMHQKMSDHNAYSLTASQLMACLYQGGDMDNLNDGIRDEEALQLLRKMNPTSIELEVEGLKDYDNGKECRLFLEFLIRQLHARRDVDLIESVLAVFLKKRGLELISFAEIGKEFHEALQVQTEVMDQLESLLDEIDGWTDGLSWIS
ncbi:U3 small nucleolar RNA-associated protein 21 [Galdieria sulphuraria]|uniref:Transducin family protein / WD-40 repeat family protein n=1 Tax=Galdieria sulphuraria TaxID=130081 RepID=M2XGD0_GALSU|nr:transducin family protein / WD-40 repeat family protein [Galdieria sulphuraria]EME29107.1 transducin family protein / WD-40 repeat family protein [Galdieria sulphuraria]GJD12690.1 U3 small nucleolar RNA-associated protein 21 [Galdieria sulphuraria]|eukprot:XP_005705627.1 transducin family protein / WD-40 repeat family protein [Galdieria sulphuraria]